MEETRGGSAQPGDPSRLRVLTAAPTLLLCSTLFLAGCGDASAPQRHSEVLQVQSDQIVDPAGNAVSLRGVQFSNWLFNDGRPEDPATYADERDYERAATMGVSTIAFDFAYDQFEDDAAPGVYKQSGFDWLDQNIARAKAAGIRLILTLGYTSGSPPINCDGMSLWDVPDDQQRTIALWQAIAKHYASEPVIAAYNLLRYPLPSGSKQQWHDLAGQLVSAIRAVDREHILIVEPPEGEQCVYDALKASDLFRVDDPNVLYEFTANVPWEYVDQLIPNQNLGDGGSYPDSTLSGLDFSAGCVGASCVQFEAIAYDSTPPETALYLKPDQTTWTQERWAYKVWNPDCQIGVPELQSNTNSGKVYFDDFVVNEYDEALNFVRTVMTVDLEDLTNWYLWQGDRSGTECPTCNPKAAQLESDSHSGNASLSLSSTPEEANLSNSTLAFPTKLHYTYEVVGWLKGEHTGPNAGARFQLAFWKYGKGALPLRDKDNLAFYLADFVAWGQANHVPLYVGDFGTGNPTFLGDKGGLRWVEDMVDLLKANQLHFTYDEYHGDDFGIYPGNQDLPDPATANQPLIDLLTRELSQ